jgi:hypothetical protein
MGVAAPARVDPDDIVVIERFIDLFHEFLERILGSSTGHGAASALIDERRRRF